MYLSVMYDIVGLLENQILLSLEKEDFIKMHRRV